MQNYKVFINNGLIIFKQKGDDLDEDLSWSDFQTISQEEIPKIVDRIYSGQYSDHLLIESDDLEKLFQVFANHFDIIEAAGGIVQNEKSDFLMIHRFEKWDFPKGHLEKGEQVYQGAMREVMEETGIKSVSISQKTPCTYHIYTFNSEWIIKKTHWYLMNTTYSGQLVPQQEEGILAAVWVPHYTMGEYMQQSYPALQDLFNYLNAKEMISSVKE